MNITQSDAELLGRMTGGLNFNRKQDPTLNVDGRFKAFVLPSVLDALNELVSRISKPADSPAAPLMMDLGALGFAATPWVAVAPGTVAVIRATVDGAVSCAESGGSFYCWGTVSDTVPGTFPHDEAVTSAGAGTSGQKLRIKAGQYFTFKHDAPTALAMHASIEIQ